MYSTNNEVFNKVHIEICIADAVKRILVLYLGARWLTQL